jgi:arylsulfatase A-like enzyme
VFFISVDTLRADHLGAYGYSRPTSPVIDALSKRGVRFDSAFAQRGLTGPSLVSIMTGLYPNKTRVRQNGVPLQKDTQSLPEILKANGYTTGAVIANATWCKWRGFDDLSHRVRTMATDLAIQWLEGNQDSRMFLWIHYMDPHMPWRPQPEYRAQFVDPDYDGKITGEEKPLRRITRDSVKLSEADVQHVHSLYDGEIAFIDAEIGRVLDAIKRLGLDERALFVFFSDHGEDLYQHNSYFFHEYSIYDSTLRIPLIFSAPGVLPTGKVARGVVEGIDLFPTVLELLDIKPPGAIDGESLVPLLRDPNATKSRNHAVSEWKDKVVTIRTPESRYVHNPLGLSSVDYPIEREELYDIGGDPTESSNIAARHPVRAQELRQLLVQWMRDFDWRFNSSTGKEPDIPDDVMEQLRNLGYVQ